MTKSVNQPTKSTSLSNFNFINKAEETIETIATENDLRRSKEKQW